MSHPGRNYSCATTQSVTCRNLAGVTAPTTLMVETFFDDNDSKTEPPPPTTTKMMTTPNNVEITRHNPCRDGNAHLLTQAPGSGFEPPLNRSYHHPYQTSRTLIHALQDTRGHYRGQMASAVPETAELYLWMMKKMKKRSRRRQGSF